jgi:predicted protein tyrosine phosphatase
MARLRSRTAHTLALGKHVEKDFCGTDKNADKPVTQAMMEWADKIVCMENCHRSSLRRKFKGYSHKIQVWNIPDDYAYLDDVLIVLLRNKADVNL